MKGVKMRVKYVNISITEDLAKKIDEFIEKAKEGYRSRAEFISEAVRLRLGIAKLKKKE
jgi:metal-responsive CopG/Arc/MetJ family transcriptional regulator